MEFSDKQIEKLIDDIYSGKYSDKELPESLYMAIGEYLEKGVKKGFSSVTTQFSGNQREVLRELRENVYLFAGAKTYQTVRAMEAMITDEGKVRSLKEFKEVAQEKYDLYNKTWAEAEYNTAIGQAQNAYAWSQFEEDKDVLPLLRYSAVIDENTSDICEPLDGITLPVDDPFWDTHMPLNHYNCRCLVEQLSEGEVSSKSEVQQATKNARAEMDDVFKSNPGKTGEVFDKEHPYFKEIPDSDKDWAKENFGLPVPEFETEAQRIEKAIENIKEKAQAFEEKYTNPIKELRQTRNNLVDEINKLNRLYFLKSEEELIKLRSQIAELKNELNLVSNKVAKLNKEKIEAVANLLENKNNPSTFKLVSKKTTENLTQGNSFFRKIVGDKMPSDAVLNAKFTSSRRAYFLTEEKAIYINKETSIVTVMHEMAHGMELFNNKYFDEVLAFYERRTAGEKAVKLSNIFPKSGYSSKEITKEDKFMNAYSGKLYLDKGVQTATEITPMWFNYVFEDLNKFIKEDPDYFESIYKMLNK